MLSRRIIFGGIASATILATSVLGMTDAMAATIQSQAPAAHAVKADLVKAGGTDCSSGTAASPAGAATSAVNGAAGAANGTINGVAGAISGVVNGVAGAAGHAGGTANGAAGAVNGAAGAVNGVVNGAAGAASGVVNGTSGLLNGLLCNVFGGFGQQAGSNPGATNS